MITWEKGPQNGTYYGYTQKDVETEDAHTYKIENWCHLIWWQTNTYVRVPCKTIADAQTMANIIEGGKDAE
jgi:hypothetical protein